MSKARNGAERDRRNCEPMKCLHTPIWMVTTYRRTADQPIGKRTFHGRRTVGYFHSEQDARTIVKGNYGDIEEAGWYRWAVIEAVPCGLYPFPDKKRTIWYEFVFGLGRGAGGRRLGRWVRLKSRKPPKPITDAIGFDRIVSWSTIG